MFRATSGGQPDPDLEDQQKAIILAALSPLASTNPSIEWTPFEPAPTAIVSPAFLTIAIADDGSAHLRVLSCPKPVNAEPDSCVSTTGISSFTRTTDPIPPDVFSAGDIEFVKSSFGSAISKLRSCHLQISTQLKQQLSTYLGTPLYAAIKNVLPFRNEGAASFNSPSTSRHTQRRSMNIALPLCWPLPYKHSITLGDDIPLPPDPASLETALNSFHCQPSAWLTGNPMFQVWLQAVNKDPQAFASKSDSFFSLNESATLHEYQASIAISRAIIADNLLARGILDLAAAIVADPSILVADVFPPSTIDPAQLCATSLTPALPWIPSFSFHQPQAPPPTQGTIPQTLTTTAASVASTVSTSSLTTSSSTKKHSPAVGRWMTLLACELPTTSRAQPIFPAANVTFTYSTVDPAASVPKDPFILSPCMKHSRH